MGPADLALVLSTLPRAHHPDLIVGVETSDDAGVFRLRDDLALVNMVDFFTPVVDDPYTYGQISAVNSLSDVYAMGGEPKTALNIVCFPQSGIDKEILADILRGGADKATEAGVVVVGGHSVADEEIK
ncbi:MAG: selenide, water dikinase SelD [Deltaproteobacteria bacterium]|nr:selenide, water dikinase SelD [Deltaproteobacteria bacterium]